MAHGFTGSSDREGKTVTRCRRRKLSDRADPWTVRLERVQGTIGNDGIERICTQTKITEFDAQRSGCRPECGWNSGGAISGNMKVSFQAARSIG